MNLTGWEKTFKDEGSPEAAAWMRNRDPKPAPKPEKPAKETE